MSSIKHTGEANMLLGLEGVVGGFFKSEHRRS